MRVAGWTALIAVALTGVLVVSGCPPKSQETAEVTPVAPPPPPETTPETTAETETTTAPTEPSEEQPAEETAEASAGEVEAVRKISHGEEVELADYVVKGKNTIFDFYSDDCPPCRALGPQLEELAEKRDDVCLVVVDINRPGESGIDWESPVARQYELQSIPHLRVYGPDGEEAARGDEARGMVEKWLSEG